MPNIRVVLLFGLLFFNVAFAEDVTTADNGGMENSKNQTPSTGTWWYDPKSAANQALQAITGETDKDKNAQNFRNSVSKKNWPNQLKVGSADE